MKIIAGLGNPGDRYESTRHNAGFWVVDELAKRWSLDCSQKKFQALTAQGIIAGEKVLLIKPQTFMNRSGQAVAAAAVYYDIPDEDMLVVYDDLALLPGMIRIRPKGSAGGHNGLKDIIAHLGSQEFPRLRVGIGQAPEFQATADYVLNRPSKAEHGVLQDAILQAADAAEVWLQHGMQHAMASFNRKMQNGALPE